MTKADRLQSPELATNKANTEKIANTDTVDYSHKNLKKPIQTNVGETGLIYKNVFKDVDFESSVTFLVVKENIIVYNPLKYYEFYYTIYASNLNLVSTTERESIVYPKTGGSRKLTISYNEYGDVDLTTYVIGAIIKYIYDYRELQWVELKDSSYGNG